MLGWMIYDDQANPMASSYQLRCRCCILKQTWQGSLLWIYLYKSFNALYLLVRLWWNIPGFGRKSEKFSHISACIRRNFTPCFMLVLWHFPFSLNPRHYQSYSTWLLRGSQKSSAGHKESSSASCYWIQANCE